MNFVSAKSCNPDLQIWITWNWIGHTLCKETGVIEKTALD